MDTTQSSPEDPVATGTVSVTGQQATIEYLVCTDPTVVSHLAAIPATERVEAVRQALSIGLHGLATVTMRATVDDMERRVRDIIISAATAAEGHIDEAVSLGTLTLRSQLDPEVRSSVTSRAVAELEEVHRTLLTRLDPDRADSHTARLVAAISDILGPDGQLAKRLTEVFDSSEAEHGMGRLMDTLDKRFREMRDLLVGEQQRKEEAQRGTAKGVEFEDIVESSLRREAGAIAGCIVERTGNIAGTLGPDTKVGDFVFSLPDGTRIAIEAKNSSKISLTGGTGILNELDRAMDNRNADWSICISHEDAYPTEVGSFGIYGNRVLVVDPGDGTLTRVALRWIAAATRGLSSGDTEIDTSVAIDKLERIRGLAQSFSRSKKVLASAQSGLNTVRDELDSLRNDLLDLVDDATRSLEPSPTPARRVA